MWKNCKCMKQYQKIRNMVHYSKIFPNNNTWCYSWINTEQTLDAKYSKG